LVPRDNHYSLGLRALQEGARSLWTGIRPTLLAAVPTVAIYMPLYDVLRDEMEPTLGSAAPITASAISRSFAVLCVAPLELMRTQLMSGQVRAATCYNADCCLDVPHSGVLSSGPSTSWLRGLNATVRHVHE
jgi:hypothetical protein